MPLLDHFHAPLSDERHWDGFHSKWANELVDHLNERLLPPEYFADPATSWDTFEVQIISTDSGPTLVAAIELVSPGNKDRDEQRRAFAVKCASYLNQGISLIFVDIVTNRHTNLHNEIAALLPHSDQFLFPANPLLYAAAYRPVLRGSSEEVDAWLIPLALGHSLPTLPLALPGDVILPVDLERTYLDACRKLRIIGNAASGLSS
jgi:hypothetical protein